MTDNTTVAEPTITTEVPTSTMDAENKAEWIMNQIVLLMIVLIFLHKKRGKRYSIKGLWEALSTYIMPRAIGTTLRQKLEELGLEGGANGSIPMFEDIGQYAGLIEYANFYPDGFEVPELDESTLNAHELKLYREARALSKEHPQESKWSKYLKALDLKEPDIGMYGQNIQIVGSELKDLDALTIDIPEVTKHLPKGARLIRYRDTAYLYVTSPCMLQIILNNIAKMGIGITPVFYQTFQGGIPTNDTSYPPCEDLPHGAEFERFPDKEMALAITTEEAYIDLVEKGIYQKYNTITEWNGYACHINRYFLFDLAAEEMTAYLKKCLLPLVCMLTDMDVLEFIKKDLCKILSQDEEALITSVLDERLDQLKALKVA